MRVAIPHWQGRVSPVLDTAGRCLLIDLEQCRQTARQDMALVSVGPLERARELVRMGADVLICGVLSRPLEMALSAAGIEVTPRICGDIEQVLTAFLDGQLNRDTFLMPGCCGRRRRFQAGRRRGSRCWRHGQKGGDNDAQR